MVGMEKMFYTLDSHMGMSNRSVKDGDVVVLLAGLENPFVLRPVRSDSFSLIGQAVMPGVMNGEAWPDGGTGLREFKIV